MKTVYTYDEFLNEGLSLPKIISSIKDSNLIKKFKKIYSIVKNNSNNEDELIDTINKEFDVDLTKEEIDSKIKEVESSEIMEEFNWGKNIIILSFAIFSLVCGVSCDSISTQSHQTEPIQTEPIKQVDELINKDWVCTSIKNKDKKESILANYGIDGFGKPLTDKIIYRFNNDTLKITKNGNITIKTYKRDGDKIIIDDIIYNFSIFKTSNNYGASYGEAVVRNEEVLGLTINDDNGMYFKAQESYDRVIDALNTSRNKNTSSTTTNDTKNYTATGTDVQMAYNLVINYIKTNYNKKVKFPGLVERTNHVNTSGGKSSIKINSYFYNPLGYRIDFTATVDLSNPSTARLKVDF